MWSCTSRWWKRLCSTPRRAASSGSTTAVAPVESISASPASAPSAATIRFSSANTRSGATAASEARTRPSRAQRPRLNRRARARRRAVRAASPAAGRARTRPARPSAACPPRDPATRRTDRRMVAAHNRLGDRVDREVALCEIVLDRLPRRAPSGRPASEWSWATTRQTPKPAESWNACPPAPRASRRAAGSTSSPARTTSRSPVSTPQARSRTAPPTSQVPEPSSASAPSTLELKAPSTPSRW